MLPTITQNNWMYPIIKELVKNVTCEVTTIIVSVWEYYYLDVLSFIQAIVDVIAPLWTTYGYKYLFLFAFMTCKVHEK